MKPPAKIIKPIGKVADVKFDRSIPSINCSHDCAFVVGHRIKCNARVIIMALNDAGILNGGQHLMCKRAVMRWKKSVDSHAPRVSRPDDVTDVLSAGKLVAQFATI